MNKKRLILALLAVLALAALAAKLMLAGSLLHPRAQRQPAPDVRFHLLDNSKPAMADYRGKAVLLSFWSVSCQICIKEIPHLNRLHADLKGRRFVLVGVDMPYDRPDWTVAFVKRYNMQYPVSFDLRGEIARAFGGIQATPTTVLIDPAGRIVWKRMGALDMGRVRRQVNALLEHDKDTTTPERTKPQ